MSAADPLEGTRQVPVSQEVIGLVLEQTLLRTDPYWEAALASIRRDPRTLWRLAVALFRGGRCELRRVLGDALASLPDLAVPVREEALETLRALEAQKTPLVFFTQLPQAWASGLVRRLGVTADIVRHAASAPIRPEPPQQTSDRRGGWESGQPVPVNGHPMPVRTLDARITDVLLKPPPRARGRLGGVEGLATAPMG